MRRADRLFRIVEYLKARRQAVTALDLAQELEVNIRTIYRDIADLGASGVPIIGEAGVGYMLDRNFVVRPLMFDAEELHALTLGIRMVETLPDKSLTRSARGAMDKISAVLPESLRAEIANIFMFSFPGQEASAIHIDFEALRHSIRQKRLIEFRYKKENGEASQRCIRPLALAHFSPVWLLAGWCEWRGAFRNFRLDRMADLVITPEKFKDEPGKTLADFQDAL